MASARKTRKKSAAVKEHSKRSGRHPNLLKILLAVVLVVALGFFAKIELDIGSETLGYKKKAQELEAQRKEISLSIAEKEELRVSILKGDASDEKILRIIRAKGYVYPDEVVYYDVD